MAKYSEQFKRSVVDEYLAGQIGFQTLARRHGLDKEMLRRWVEHYRQHGAAGLSKKYGHYDERFRLSVLQYMWGNELSYAQTARHFDIRSPAVVGKWDRLYHDGGEEALKPGRRGKMKKMPESRPPTAPPDRVEDDQRSREELLAELNYLRMENEYLKKLRALVQAQQQAAPHKKRK